MGKVVADITMSLDGFVAGPNPTLEEPLGRDGEELHEWALETTAWREQHGLEGRRGERGLRGNGRARLVRRRPRDGQEDVQRRIRALGGGPEVNGMVGR